VYTFDLKNCVTWDNRTFVWDTRTKSVVEIEMRAVSIAETPEEVIKALLTAASKNK
jgi:hypothetical protein